MLHTILVILAVIAIAALAVVLLQRAGKIKDRDNDLIPDAVEDTYEDVKQFTDEAIEDVKETIEEVKATAKEIKRRAKNVKAEIADVLEEAQEVVDAFKGKVTKSKLRKLTKKQLQQHSQKKFGVEMEDKLNKSNMINQVYSLHHKK
jgi:signal transduction histidine kinase